MLLGSTDILLTELLALLTPAQHAVLRQVAVCRAPMTRDDLASALGPGPDGNGPAPDQAGLAGDVDRLTDLTLLMAGDEVAMHPWTAAQVTRHLPGDLSPEHERALAMRYRRFAEQRGTLDDLTDIARHLAALHRYDDIADLAGQAMRIVPGTLSLVACLAEMRPLIPPDERASIVVAAYEVDALLRAGDMQLATQQLRAIRGQAEAQVLADPADDEGQRLLAVIHERLGDVAITAGDAGRRPGRLPGVPGHR